MSKEEEISRDWEAVSVQLKAFQDKWGKPSNDLIFIQGESEDGYFIVSPAFDKDALSLRER